MNTTCLAWDDSCASARGVTLIELMIVVTVVSVLTMISIPAYKGYAERAHRAEVLSAMVAMKTKQESFHVTNDRYADDAEDLGFTDGCTERCVYLITFDGTPDTQFYKARFTPNPDGGSNGVDQTGDDECSWFTIDSLDRREAENESCLSGM